MRHQLRALVLVVVSLIAAMTLTVASAFVSAFAYGATALIVPGTGTPNADEVGGYRENAWSRYINGVACTDPVDCADPDLVGVPYPASFYPLSFLPGWCVPGRCEKWNVSVEEGVQNLMGALAPFLAEDSDEDVFIFGYSQGGAVVANALTELGALGLSDEVKDRLKVVTIGGIENPDGGLWQRLAWLQYFLGDPIPFLDLSFDPPMPVDTGIDTTTIGFEYDPVVYAPRYWGNIFSVLNMVAAFDTVHGYYLDPTEKYPDDTMPYGYDDATLKPQLNCDLNPGNCRTDSFGNSYIIIPATSLPLTDLVRSLADSLGIGALAKPFIDLVEPVMREIVDLGYDWTGDPGVPTRSTILPFKIFQNWVKVGIDFAVAAVQGIEAFIRNFIPAEPGIARLDDTDDERSAAVPSEGGSAGTIASVSPLRSATGFVEADGDNAAAEEPAGDAAAVEEVVDEAAVDEAVVHGAPVPSIDVNDAAAQDDSTTVGQAGDFPSDVDPLVDSDEVATGQDETIADRDGADTTVTTPEDVTEPDSAAETADEADAGSDTDTGTEAAA